MSEFDFAETDFADEAGVDDLYLTPEEVPIPADHPMPQLWRVLVMPIQPRKMSKGGIALAQATQEAEAHLNYIGKVVAMGPLAGTSEKFMVDGNRYYDAKVGDWVIYGRYAGQVCWFRDVKFLFISDDEILGISKSPDGFRIYA